MHKCINVCACVYIYKDQERLICCYIYIYIWERNADIFP